ncbi:branched-chain amino acid ABC transporter permease [Glycomyces artemisiae]|uniref:Amino acid/amide ABC transporter membrane protein 2 (HAAT family) n=1 Tax=Glycomyces artemisiae TaxID=1076443 RepID=A0A2T0UVV2_9ACTN|nr:branched-chain amino acid ABC transporter permease [Glycomyces artemisiae]PRY61967.1 amino acid/amide ABC transporter membrane protein 2 (HAAT family) [Glycomyces artemisiae]
MDWQFVFSQALTQAIGPTMLVYALGAIGLNLQFGYTGLLNFGQAAFAAMGAYGLALSVVAMGLPFWWGIVIGLLAACVMALLLGIPTLRLRADYLAIVTIAAAEIVRRIARATVWSDTTGGSDGMRGFSEPFFEMIPWDRDTTWSFLFVSMDNGRLAVDFGIFELQYSYRDTWVMIVGWTLVAVILVVMAFLIHSPWGRVLKGIREDEEAVRSLGKNVFAYKMQALVLGGIIGAIAGFVFALSRANVQPDAFTTDFTFYFYVVLILGGAARIFGPVLGAALFWFLYNILAQGLIQAISADVIPPSVIDSTQVGPLVFFLLGLGMVLLLIFRPQGLIGNRKELMFDVR